MIDERFVIASGILNIFACIPYIIGTLKGTTKPNRVTWFLWTLASFVAFYAQLKQGVGLLAFTTISAGIGPLFVFIASFINPKSFWKITLFDMCCGTISLLGLLLWYITQVGNIAIALSIFADSLAALPTVIKAYKYPQTENALAFFISGLNGLVALLAIKTWTFMYYGFPLYLFLCNYLIFWFIQFNPKKNLNKI